MTVKQPKAKRLFCILAILVAVAAALLFFVWLRDKTHTHFVSLLFAGLSLAGIAYLLISVFMPEKEFAAGERITRRDRIKIIAAVIVSRIMLYLLGYFFLRISGGAEGGFFETLAKTWRIGYGIDAPSYLGIAENGYVTAGDAMYHIVFLPFYPICVKLFSFITGEFFYSGFLVSDLCFAGACILLCELTAMDHGRKAGMRAVRYLMLLPAAFFFAIPMTESLFLLLSLGCVYSARKGRTWAAGAIGMLAAFTRIQGVLLMVPIAFEFYRNREKTVKWWSRHIAAVGITGLGVLGYLAVNYALYGDAFQFMTFQREHWHQGFNPFYDTVHYQTEYLIGALSKGDLRGALGLYLPCLLTVFGSLRIMIAVRGKLRRAETAYFAVYFILSIGSAWLLSAPRYMLAAYPVVIGLAAAANKPARDIEISLVLLALQCAYLWMFVSGYPIY